MSNTSKSTDYEAFSANFIDLLDQAEYARAYASLAPQMQATLTKSEWTKKLDAFRNPLGKCLTREISTVSTSTSMDSLPDGKYLTFKYVASFEHKSSAEETTVVCSVDGKMYVFGYVVR